MNTFFDEHIKLCEETLSIAPNDFSVMDAMSNLLLSRADLRFLNYASNKDINLVKLAKDDWKQARNLYPERNDGNYILAIFNEALAELILGNETSALQLLDKLNSRIQNIPINDLKNIIVRVKAIESKLLSHPKIERLLGHLLLKVGDAIWDMNNGKQEPVQMAESIKFWRLGLNIFKDENTTELREIRFKLALLCHLTAQQEEAIQEVDTVLRMQQEAIDQHPLKDFNIRFMQKRSCTLQNIGHLMNEPEFLIKMKILGFISDLKPALIAPKADVVNKAALNKWRDQITVITDSRLCKRFEPLQKELEYNTFWIKPSSGKPRYFWSGLNYVQRNWEKKNREPLIKLTNSEKELGWEKLESMGIPRGSWIVTLHVRDQTLGKDGRAVISAPTANRDADLFTYIPAIEEIVNRGGYVVRMGSASMKPLPKLKGVLDYAHSSIKCEFMDLFCIAESKFFLGTASGLNGIPTGFGVPSLLTNISPMNIFALCNHDLYMPKLLRCIKTGKLLNFEHGMKPPFDHLFSSAMYLQAGVEFIDNTPEEIKEITIEMLERLTGAYQTTREDEELQALFHEIATKAEPEGIGCRIGAKFLYKYKELLGITTLNDIANFSSAQA